LAANNSKNNLPSTMAELLKKSLPIKKIQGKDLLVDAHYVDSDAPGLDRQFSISMADSW
jgi:hypothetical protein